MNRFPIFRSFSIIVFLFSISLTVTPGCTPPDPTKTVYYVVTASTSGGGTVTPTSATVLSGKTQKFTATPSEGYRFSKWQIGSDTSNTSTDNPLTLTVTSDMTLSALFKSTLVNTKPVAYDVAVTTTKNTPVNLTLSATDEDGDALTLNWTSPSHGKLSGSGPILTYTPNTDYVGTDSFTYKANDGKEDSDSASVLITVTEPASIGWAKSFGSEGVDYVNDVAVDSSGNIFVVGCFTGTVDFDPGANTVLYQSQGKKDMFLSKFSPDGTFQWVRTIGGSEDDEAMAVGVESTGNIYVVGTFSGTVSFTLPEHNIPSITSRGGTDALIAKFNTAGTCAWAIQVGGTGNDYGLCVAPENSPSQNIVLGGSFTGTVDFDPTSSNDTITSNGKSDGFVTELSGTGEYLGTLSFGGTGDDEVTAVGCDSYYNLRIAGNFSSPTINLNPFGEDIKSSIGGQDIFLVRIDSNMTTYAWGEVFGGPEDDTVTCLTCNSTGTTFIGGSFKGTVDFDPTAGTSTYTAAGGSDGFISAINGTGAYQWTHLISGTGEEQVNKLATLSTSNLFAAGSFSGTADFDPHGTGDTKQSRGLTDAFLTELNVSGGSVSTWTVGGASSDMGSTVATSTQWMVYWGGGFQSTADLDPRSSTENHTSFGGYDCFLIKMTNNGEW